VFDDTNVTTSEGTHLQQSIATASSANVLQHADPDKLDKLEWKKFTTRKQTAVAKKHKITETPVIQHDPEIRDRAFCALREVSTADVTMAMEQPNEDDDESATSLSSYKRRVPLTMLATDDDFKFGTATKKPSVDTPGDSSQSAAVIGGNSNPTSSLKQAVASVKFADSTKVAPLSSAPGQIANPVLPSLTGNIETTSMTFFTYRAQLTFGLPTPSDGVNVAKYFRRWIYSSCASIDNFGLLPYDDEKGQQISSSDQVPEDNADFYSTYYHNHRVLNRGNLTGMVMFQCSTPWARLKNPTHPFFNWLRLNKVYLNQTKFKALL
jgi:hypothetical protein